MTTPINQSDTDMLRRAQGALTGLAIGDALGMPTQSMSAEQITQAYGGAIHDFVDAVDWQPIAPGRTAGKVTDDTDQAFLLARRLIADGTDIDILAYAQDLLQWEEAMKAQGSADLLGPSTKAALEALNRGVPPEYTGRTGTTNGGAMRVAPVGIAVTPGEQLAATVRRSCIVTHNTVQGIDAAMVVASAVSYGINGASLVDALHWAVKFTESCEQTGCWSAKASVLTRTRMAVEWVENRGSHISDDDFCQWLRNVVGTSVEANESVPAAFAIARRHAAEPFDALCMAASVGGDTDTIAAMAGAIIGACNGPDVFGTEHRKLVEQVNTIDIDGVAAQLIDMRLADMWQRQE